jgi:tetratricopeptide (TPR) repeat protein
VSIATIEGSEPITKKRKKKARQKKSQVGKSGVLLAAKKKKEMEAIAKDSDRGARLLLTGDAVESESIQRDVLSKLERHFAGQESRAFKRRVEIRLCASLAAQSDSEQKQKEYEQLLAKGSVAGREVLEEGQVRVLCHALYVGAVAAEECLDLSAAERCYTNALLLADRYRLCDVGVASTRCNLARLVLTARGDLQRAEELYAQCAGDVDDDVYIPALVGLASCSLERGRVGDAEQLYLRAQRCLSDVIEAQQKVGKTSASSSSSSDGADSDGDVDVEDEEDDARRQLKRLLASVCEGLGCVRYRQKRHSEAYELFESVVADHPSDRPDSEIIPSLVFFARLHRATDKARGEALLKRALAAARSTGDANQFGILFSLAQMLDDQSRHAEANTYWRQARACAPDALAEQLVDSIDQRIGMATTLAEREELAKEVADAAGDDGSRRRRPFDLADNHIWIAITAIIAVLFLLFFSQALMPALHSFIL